MTHFRLEQVAEGAWAAIADSDLAAGNAGVVDLGGEMLVFDTSWTPAAAHELTGLGPVRWVVNSHWHGDHVRGNHWLETVDRLAGLDFDVLVPGHGEVGGRSDLEDFRAYLGDIVVAAAEEHGANAPIPERYRAWAFEDGWTRNLAFLTGSRPV